jgi:hypothetical protein
MRFTIIVSFVVVFAAIGSSETVGAATQQYQQAHPPPPARAPAVMPQAPRAVPQLTAPRAGTGAGNVNRNPVPTNYGTKPQGSGRGTSGAQTTRGTSGTRATGTYRPRKPTDFHHRDIHRLSAHEFDVWRGGGWHNEWHDGHLGWWWVADDNWYFYSDPIYPYPTDISDAYADAGADAGAGGDAPPATSTDAGLAPPTFWYLCDNPHGYYPYVTSCAAWRAVPTAPAAAQ